MSASQCLKHKWLSQCDTDMSCVKISTDKLKKFIIRRKWQVNMKFLFNNYQLYLFIKIVLFAVS